jgi:transposase
MYINDTINMYKNYQIKMYKMVVQCWYYIPEVVSVLINIATPVDIRVDRLSDLKILRRFMEDNNLKANKSEIARQLGVDRRTVDKYLKGFEKSTRRSKPSRLDEYYDTIKNLLSSETQVFFYRSVLYRYLRDNCGMQVPEQTFYHYLRRVPEFDAYFRRGNCAVSAPKPILRYETAPGEQAQVDWKESIPFVLADTGEVVEINVLVIVLGNSRFRIFKPSLCKSREVLIHLLVEAFETLGGVPKKLLTDNMKTVMDVARTTEQKGKINTEFEAFANDFGFKLMPCIAATPKTKGKVESQMKLLDEIRAYNGKLNLVELYDLIERINSRANNKISQGSGLVPVLSFKKEKDSLQPLPHESIRNQYKIKTAHAKVNTAAMINFKSNQYSVPSAYIGKVVSYQVHDSDLHIYFNTKLIAVHPISSQKLNYEAEHYKAALCGVWPGKSDEDISQMAKKNLDIIGGVYSDE